ncbi:hypothetical protein THASP1DRAFT_23807 [Thamnocephalis sphaerospora]|uniref:WD40-repeat-containing domain protein n=1 Tax=Thamnocephalis sphaerospora TaxID=78915 RepID=A0A4P9XQ37_9FUNG|nr:hypothetical protein THASP1DRAFT_23807 [Thamnocephalis sphaerospora]|eukprot:RKP08144.1 hypothetical protein THASP1DRAFT_23807 [Thamnocephalis sphaerospora]
MENPFISAQKPLFWTLCYQTSDIRKHAGISAENYWPPVPMAKHGDEESDEDNDEEEAALDRTDAGHQFTSVGYDGRVRLTDTRNPWQPIHVQRYRTILVSCAWTPGTSSILYGDNEYNVRYVMLGGAYSRAMITHSACIWDIATSDRHPYIASVSADGQLLLNNPHRVWQDRPRMTQYAAYKLTYDSERQCVVYTTASSVEEIRAEKASVLLIDYPRPVALHRAVWNHNAGPAAQWLASGGAAGLVHVASMACDDILDSV